MDRYGNKVAREGLDRCFCGCKYWEDDQCIDCGENIASVIEARREEGFEDILD